MVKRPPSDLPKVGDRVRCLEDRGVCNLTPDRSLPMTTETVSPLRQRMIEDMEQPPGSPGWPAVATSLLVCAGINGPLSALLRFRTAGPPPPA
jgi:hypothetical protein